MCDEFDEIDDSITLHPADFAILQAMAVEYGETSVEEFLSRVLSVSENCWPCVKP